MPQTPTPYHIELRLRDLGQLFNSLDPTPFRHKDLDPEAERFIDSWALEAPAGSEFRITVHLEHAPADAERAELVGEALGNFFEYKADLTRRELRHLLQQGSVSLVIGVGFLALCLLAADAIARREAGTFLTVLRESLTIGGWVAMWRPMQIFLYDWWPLERRQRRYRRLARAVIAVEIGG